VLTLRTTRGAHAQTGRLIEGRQDVAEQREALNKSKPTGKLSVEIISPEPSSATGPNGTIEFRLRGANLSFADPDSAGLPPRIPQRVRVLVNGRDVTDDVNWTEERSGLRGKLAYTTSARAWRTPARGRADNIFVIPPVAVLVAMTDGQGGDQGRAAWSFVPQALPTELIVSCIGRDRRDPDRSIDELGGLASGVKWRLALNDALALHDRGTRFFIKGPGDRLVPLHVVTASRDSARHFQAMPNKGAVLTELPDCKQRRGIKM
jgi:hypothetical protein